MTSNTPRFKIAVLNKAWVFFLVKTSLKMERSFQYFPAWHQFLLVLPARIKRALDLSQLCVYTHTKAKEQFSEWRGSPLHLEAWWHRKKSHQNESRTPYWDMERTLKKYVYTGPKKSERTRNKNLISLYKFSPVSWPIPSLFNID